MDDYSRDKKRSRIPERVSVEHFPNLASHPCLAWAIHSEEIQVLKPRSQDGIKNVVQAFRERHTGHESFLLVTLRSQGSERTEPGSSRPNRPSLAERSRFIGEGLLEALSGKSLSVIDVHQGGDGSRS